MKFLNNMFLDKKIENKITCFFTALFVFTIPLKENWSSISLLVLITYSLIISYKSRKVNLKLLSEGYIRKFLILGLAGLIIGIISLIGNVQIDTRFDRFSFISLLIVFILMFGLNIFKHVPIRILIYSLFFSLSISGVLRLFKGVENLILYGNNFLPSIQKLTIDDYISTHSIEYGLLLNFCWCFFSTEYFRKRINIKKFILLVLAIILFLLTNFTLSGFILFFLVFFLVFFFYKCRMYFRVLSNSLMILSLFSFLFILTPQGKEFLTKVEGESSRVRNYETSIEIIKTIPFFGYGVGNEFSTLQKNRREGTWEFKNKYNAHNQYFESIIGGGWPNLIIFITMLLYAFYYSYKNENILLTVFIVIISITMLIESLLVVHKGFVFVSYFWAYLIFQKNNELHN